MSTVTEVVLIICVTLLIMSVMQNLKELKEIKLKNEGIILNRSQGCNKPYGTVRPIDREEIITIDGKVIGETVQEMDEKVAIRRGFKPNREDIK